MRLFLAVDHAVNLVSGYSYRYGWRKKKTAAALEDMSSKGAIHKGRPHREGEGGSQKADIVREVAWIYYC